MPEISRNPPAIGRLEETLIIIEEIDARLRGIKEALALTAIGAEQGDGSSIRDFFEAIGEIGHVIDEVEVGIDMLETRISTIENLKIHQK
ncbi:MAG: hypothetical protein ACFFEA_09695 [Candidatus Thorarchaeota archaeon]